MKIEANRKTQTSHERKKKNQMVVSQEVNFPYYSKWVIQHGYLLTTQKPRKKIKRKKKKKKKKNPPAKNRIASFMAPKQRVQVMDGLEI